MKMERRKLRIGDLAEQVGVKRFVIRFWEKEFDMESLRSDGGQRHYDHSDFQKFSLIKKLLYEDRLTIEGAKKVLMEHFNQQEQNKIQVQASSKTSLDSLNTTDSNGLNFEKEKILLKLDGMPVDKLIELQKKLIRLREVL